MKLLYVVQKFLRKAFNRPCINNSIIDKKAKVDIGTIVIGTLMGRYSYIGEHSSVLNTEIGAFTCISNYCAIGGGNHPMEWVSMSPVFNTSKGIIKEKLGSMGYSPFEKVHIGNDVWIGSHVLIKSGVTISDGAVIGMGAVVTHDIGPYEIWAGNPARLIRKRFDDETIVNLKDVKWWKWNEEKLKEYAAFFSNPRELIRYVEENKN